MQKLATNLGESTMFNRAGGAPTFAVGMADMFARVSAGPTALAVWYHFAIMFEALFILTTIDAGTRVGRFLLQDFVGRFYEPLGRKEWLPGSIIASVLLVVGWAWFIDSNNFDTIWRMFGIA